MTNEAKPRSVPPPSPFAELESARISVEHHYRVREGLRVVIQVRNVNIYTYAEELTSEGGASRKSWRIRPGTIATHGSGNFHAAKSGAAHLFQELKTVEHAADTVAQIAEGVGL